MKARDANMIWPLVPRQGYVAPMNVAPRAIASEPKVGTPAAECTAAANQDELPSLLCTASVSDVEVAKQPTSSHPQPVQSGQPALAAPVDRHANTEGAPTAAETIASPEVVPKNGTCCFGRSSTRSGAAPRA